MRTPHGQSARGFGAASQAPPRSFALLPLGAAALLLAAGCGGGSKSSAPTTTTTAAATTTAPSQTAPLGKAAYVSKMRAIGRSLNSSLNSLSSATTADAAATALEAVQTDLRTAADKIEAITPPDAIKAQHAQLEKAVRDFADELGPIVTKLKAGQMTALSQVATLKGVQEIQSASTAIASKGYKIGG
jgi:hypothetical protein